jgi:hypothetical protein
MTPDTVQAWMAPAAGETGRRLGVTTTGPLGATNMPVVNKNLF